MTGENAAFYQPSDARVKSAKGPTLFLELYIDKIAVSTHQHERSTQTKTLLV